MTNPLKCSNLSIFSPGIQRSWDLVLSTMQGFFDLLTPMVLQCLQMHNNGHMHQFKHEKRRKSLHTHTHSASKHISCASPWNCKETQLTWIQDLPVTYLLAHFIFEPYLIWKDMLNGGSCCKQPLYKEDGSTLQNYTESIYYITTIQSTYFTI